MSWIIASHSPLVVISNWCWEKCVAKVLQNWRHKVQLVNWCNNSPLTMGQILHEGLVMVKRWVAPRTCVIWHEMWPCAIWEQSWNDCEDLYLEFFGWKHFWKCSKIILEGGHLQINVICVGIPTWRNHIKTWGFDLIHSF
jgi:hypothetical protein